MPDAPDVDEMVRRRKSAIRSEIADRADATPRRPVYPAAHSTVRDGSHLHGLVLLAGAELCAGDDGYEPWLPAAVAVDYLDAFARTHHRAFGDAGRPRDGDRFEDALDTRILAGDLLFTRATELVLETDVADRIRRSTVRVLTTAGRRLCEDAIRHRDLAREGAATVDRYVRAVDETGGALAAASGELAGLLGGGTDDQVAALSGFGRNLGISVRLYAAARVIGTAPTGAAPGGTPARRSDRRVTGESFPDPFDACIETLAPAVPPLPSRVETDGGSVRSLRRAAEARLSLARERLDDLPDSRPRSMLSGLADRVEAAGSAPRQR